MVNAAVAAGQVTAKKDESRSSDMIVMKDSFYDMNTWTMMVRQSRLDAGGVWISVDLQTIWSMRPWHMPPTF